MKKSEFLEKIADLGMDEDIVLTLTYPKPDEGYTMGEDDSVDNSQIEDSDSPSDDDDGSLDNEDGTVTDFYPEYDVDGVEVDDDDTNTKKKVAFVNLDLDDGEDEDDDEEGDEDDSPSDN